jgi:hypothetical protein
MKGRKKAMKNNNFSGDNSRKEDILDPVIEMLRPRALPPMPAGIKANVLSKIRRREALKNFFTMKNTVSKIVASTASIAAAVVIAVVSVKPTAAHAARVEAILDRSYEAAGEVRTMRMKIDVRTEPHESFAYTNPLRPMVEHTLTVVCGEPVCWRLEKGERTVLFDGREKYLWYGTDSRVGYKGDRTTGFEEWFDILLDPRVVPMREKAAMAEEVKYHVEDRDDEIVLRADVKARGDFSNPYLRNSSIDESDTSRELVFDRATGLLKSMKIYAKVAGVKSLLVDVKSIEYDVPVECAALTALPEGYEWRDVTAAPPAGLFSGITAEEAARKIADAITNGDLTPVREAFAQYDMASISQQFDGARVVKVGKPFRSGLYAGVFVPFKVRMAGGRTKNLKIALRRDNPNGVWLVDGGI